MKSDLEKQLDAVKAAVAAKDLELDKVCDGVVLL